MYLFPVVSRILLFFGTHTHSTFFRYSSRQFFDTRMDSTFSWYSTGFYHFSLLTMIRPFSCNRRDCFSILARILLFPGTFPDSTVFLYSYSFDPFPVLVRTIFRYSHGFYLFPVLNWILLFFDTHIDLTIFFIIARKVFRYSHGFYIFPVLSRILLFFGTHIVSTIFL